MSTIKDLAANCNLFQIADIPAKYRGDTANFEHKLKINFKSIPDHLKIMPGIEVGLFYECKQDTNYQQEITYYIEGSFILLKQNDSDTLLMLMTNRDKKYYLHPYWGLVHKYHGIYHSIKNDALKTITEPNLIGVFTDKKVWQWIDYCKAYIQVLDLVLAEVNNGNTVIQNKIDTFINSVPGCKVSKYQNTTDIETSMFRVRFDHYKDQKYLSTKIDFKGTINDIVKIETV